MIFYVGRTGSDQADGRSAATAFGSLGHAAHVATPGDTLVLVPGIYEADLPKQLMAARARGFSVSVDGAEKD